MRKLLFFFVLGCSAWAATKPASPSWQSSNSLASGCVRYWVVGNSTTTLDDYTPSAYNVTVVGSPSLVAAPGGVGNEYSFTGSQLPSTAADAAMPSNASAGWSVAMWVKTSYSITPQPSRLELLGWGNHGANSNQDVTISFANYSSYGSWTANAMTVTDNESDNTTSSVSVNDGNWHRVVMTYATGTIKYYTDGTLTGSSSINFNLSLPGSLQLFNVANNTWGAGYTGAVGDIAVWNRELSSTEVTADNTDPWQEIRPGSGPLTAGAISATTSGVTANNLSSVTPTGGTSPYSYQWQRTTHGGSSWANICTNLLTCADTGLSAGTTYDYRLVSTDSVPASVTSSTLSEATLFAMDGPNVSLTPGSWYLSGSSPAAWAATNRTGAHVGLTFSGTSIAVVLNTTNMATAANTLFSYSVDDAPYVTNVSMPSPSSTATLIIASGLAAGTHTLHFWVQWYGALNVWNVNGSVPDYAVQLIGFQLDAGASLSTPPSVPSDKLLCLGDSITAGARVPDGSSYGDSQYSYCQYLSQGLNSELSNSAFPGSAWSFAVTGTNVPAFATAFGYYWAGQPRVLTNIYKRAIVNLGTNDGGEGDGSLVAADLALLRTALGSATRLYLVTSFRGYSMSLGMTTYCGSLGALVTVAGTRKYQTCAGDSKAFLIDLGTDGSLGMTPGPASFQSADALHPNVYTHGKFAAYLLQVLNSIEGGGSGSSGGAVAFVQ